MKLIAVLLLLSLPCLAAPALVGCTNGSSNATNTVVVTRTTTGGNFLVLAVSEGTDATTTWTVADTASNTWTQVPAGYVSDDGSNSRQDIRYIANALSITSVTATFSSSPNTNGAILCEYSGMANASPVDTSVNIQGSGFVATLTSGVYTTPNASDVLFYSVRMTGSVSAPTAGSGYTIPTNGTVGSRHTVQYNIVSSTQSSQTTSLSWTSTARASGAFAAFKGASTATPGHAPLSY